MAFSHLIHKCWATNPDKRLQFDEIIAILESYEESLRLDPTFFLSYKPVQQQTLLRCFPRRTAVRKSNPLEAWSDVVPGTSCTFSFSYHLCQPLQNRMKARYYCLFLFFFLLYFEKACTNHGGMELKLLWLLGISFSVGTPFYTDFCSPESIKSCEPSWLSYTLHQISHSSHHFCLRYCTESLNVISISGYFSQNKVLTMSPCGF